MPITITSYDIPNLPEPPPKHYWEVDSYHYDLYVRLMRRGFFRNRLIVSHSIPQSLAGEVGNTEAIVKTARDILESL